MYRRCCRSVLTVATVLLTARTALAVPLQVVTVSPARLAVAAGTSAVTITFDRAVQPASITTASFRVFGKQSGAATGPVTFSNANASVTLTPSRPFVAGEVVHVNVSHDVLAADTTPLRSAGYTYQFRIQTAPASRTFTQIQQMSNRTSPGTGTRIYGAMAADLDSDGWVDLTTVNEDSADLRVFMNRADGTGTYGAFLTPVKPIGVESSPNESCDFDGDGKIDIAVSATTDGAVWVVKGAGTGGWGAAQHQSVGTEPHGVAVLDVDGDGDWDVANANHGSNNWSLMINNAGTLGAPSFFEAGGDGEYAMNAGDMDNDGIADLVIGTQDDHKIIVLHGNGDGTFTPGTPQDAGGWVWKLVLGDINGDGNLDVAAVNGDSSNAATLLGNGDGTLQPPTVYPVSGTAVGTVLGDLDGDGDLDWVVSSFSGGIWKVFANDGNGVFTADPDITAISNPSCAIMLDVDGDGDLDLALTDEIADVVKILRNDGGAAPLCPPTPDTCRAPAAGKGVVQFIDKSPDTNDRLVFKWLKGAATQKTDFGDPLHTENYVLCLYDNDGLIRSTLVTGSCGAKPCWADKATGFTFHNKSLSPSGVQSLLLKAGVAGKASVVFKGKGLNLALPAPDDLTGPLDLQLRQTSGTVCFGARFSAPFKKKTSSLLKDTSD